MKNLDLFNEYQKEYRALQKRQARHYPYSWKIPFSKICNILFYEGQGDKAFLIVPSIFNSHDILTLGAPGDLITNLRKMGCVYLIEWLEVENKDFGLDDYASEVAKVLEGFRNIHLIGHCLGGSFAVAASLLHPEQVKSLTLLTTPWDFEHFAAPKVLYNAIGLAKAVEGMDHIPAIYLQILFFLLSPESFEQKLDFYQANQKDISNSNFFDVERWQFSGHPIPRKTYDDLMDRFIDGNILEKGLWVVDGIAIDPTKIKMPIMMVICNKDKLVPKSSGGILSSLARVFEYNSGHIGYLVGSQKERFLKDLTDWISGCLDVSILENNSYTSH